MTTFIILSTLAALTALACFFPKSWLGVVEEEKTFPRLIGWYGIGRGPAYFRTSGTVLSESIIIGEGQFLSEKIYEHEFGDLTREFWDNDGLFFTFFTPADCEHIGNAPSAWLDPVEV